MTTRDRGDRYGPMEWTQRYDKGTTEWTPVAPPRRTGDDDRSRAASWMDSSIDASIPASEAASTAQRRHLGISDTAAASPSVRPAGVNEITV